MERSQISDRIMRISQDAEELKCQLRAVDSLDIGRFPKKYDHMLSRAALLSEGIACKLRALVYASSGVPKPEYLRTAAKAFPVKVGYDGEIFTISLPCLLPKKSGKHTGIFLMEPVDTAISQYAAVHTLPKFKACSICIVHEYMQNKHGTRVFDYDNLEQKQLLDTIAMHVLTDDNATLCDVFHTAQEGKLDATRVFIMPQTSFPGWLLQRTLDKFPLSDFP